MTWRFLILTLSVLLLAACQPDNNETENTQNNGEQAENEPDNTDPEQNNEVNNNDTAAGNDEPDNENNDENNNKEPFNNEEEETEPVISETEAGDFTLKLRSEKPVYSPGEEVGIQAKLKYSGPAEEIEITHGESPFLFDIVEINRGATVNYFVRDIEMETTLENGIWYEEDFVKRISYSETDEHVDFYHTYMTEDGFPPGEYEIELRSQFATTVEEVPENHTYTTSIVIEVTE